MGRYVRKMQLIRSSMANFSVHTNIVDLDQTALKRLFIYMYKCRLLIILVNSLDPDQVKSADDKEHRNYHSMQRVNSTGHGFDWKIEHV